MEAEIEGDAVAEAFDERAEVTVAEPVKDTCPLDVIAERSDEVELSSPLIADKALVEFEFSSGLVDSCFV